MSLLNANAGGLFLPYIGFIFPETKIHGSRILHELWLSALRIEQPRFHLVEWGFDIPHPRV